MKKFSKRLKIRERTAFDLDRIISTLAGSHSMQRKITSILLEEDVVRELERVAANKEISYQALVRVLILDALKRVEKVS